MAARIGRIIIFHQSSLCKAKFFILCGVIFLVRLQGIFDTAHPCESSERVNTQFKSRQDQKNDSRTTILVFDEQSQRINWWGVKTSLVNLHFGSILMFSSTKIPHPHLASNPKIFWFVFLTPWPFPLSTIKRSPCTVGYLQWSST